MHSEHSGDDSFPRLLPIITLPAFGLKRDCSIDINTEIFLSKHREDDFKLSAVINPGSDS